MFALKLVLVPFFLALVTLAARRWGAAVAGRLAGLPVVTGPILFVVAIEQGVGFAADVAVGAIAAMAAGASFNFTYSHMCRRFSWRWSLAASLAAWGSVGACITVLIHSPLAALACAVSALCLALWWQPKASLLDGTPLPFRRHELWVRMAAGAALTVLVSGVAATIGTAWTGLIAVFPVMGSVLSVFSHRAQGPAYVVTLLQGMMFGMIASAFFCLVVAIALPRLGIALGFTAAIAVALVVQTIVWQIAAAPARSSLKAQAATADPRTRP